MWKPYLLRGYLSRGYVSQGVYVLGGPEGECPGIYFIQLYINYS